MACYVLWLFKRYVNLAVSLTRFHLDNMRVVFTEGNRQIYEEALVHKQSLLSVVRIDTGIFYTAYMYLEQFLPYDIVRYILEELITRDIQKVLIDLPKKSRKHFKGYSFPGNEREQWFESGFDDKEYQTVYEITGDEEVEEGERLPAYFRDIVLGELLEIAPYTPKARVEILMNYSAGLLLVLITILYFTTVLISVVINFIWFLSLVILAFYTVMLMFLSILYPFRVHVLSRDSVGYGIVQYVDNRYRVKFGHPMSRIAREFVFFGSVFGRGLVLLGLIQLGREIFSDQRDKYRAAKEDLARVHEQKTKELYDPKGNVTSNWERSYSPLKLPERLLRHSPSDIIEQINKSLFNIQSKSGRGASMSMFALQMTTEWFCTPRHITERMQPTLNGSLKFKLSQRIDHRWFYYDYYSNKHYMYSKFDMMLLPIEYAHPVEIDLFEYCLTEDEYREIVRENLLVHVFRRTESGGR